jgi:hypothetical protein
LFKKCECTVDVNLKLFVILSDNNNSLRAALYRHTVFDERNLTLSEKNIALYGVECEPFSVYERIYFILRVCKQRIQSKSYVYHNRDGSWTELWTTTSRQKTMCPAVI